MRIATYSATLCKTHCTTHFSTHRCTDQISITDATHTVTQTLQRTQHPLQHTLQHAHVRSVQHNATHTATHTLQHAQCNTATHCNTRVWLMPHMNESRHTRHSGSSTPIESWHIPSQKYMPKKGGVTTCTKYRLYTIEPKRVIYRWHFLSSTLDESWHKLSQKYMPENRIVHMNKSWMSHGTQVIPGLAHLHSYTLF